MELAKRVLEKYGWTEGQGLGKNLDGIKEPLKAKKKFDKGGVGHSLSQTFTDHWWEAAFNSAANSIKIQTTENGVKMKSIKKENSNKLSIQKIHSLPNRFESCGFLKRETLENGKLVMEKSIVEDTTAPVVSLSDEQLFKACGGRTVHKGARHGLTLSGKLQRLQMQDQALLKFDKKRDNSETEHTENSLLQNTSPIRPYKKSLCSITTAPNEQVSEGLSKVEEHFRKGKRKRKEAKDFSFAEKTKQSSYKKQKTKPI